MRQEAFVVVVQLPSHVWLFGIPWTVARQPSLSFTVSWGLLKLMATGRLFPISKCAFHTMAEMCLVLFAPPHPQFSWENYKRAEKRDDVAGKGTKWVGGEVRWGNVSSRDTKFRPLSLPAHPPPPPPPNSQFWPQAGECPRTMSLSLGFIFNF